MPRVKEAMAASSKKEMLRRTVLEAAGELFSRKGFGGTNLQDIADALGISRTALYYYFSSKEEILASLVEEVTVSSRKQLTRVAAQVDIDPSDALRLITRNHVKWLLDHAGLFRVVDRTEDDLPPQLRQVHEDAKQAVLNDFSHIIERGISTGRFRPVDSRIAAFSIIGMCSWTTWWFNPDGRRSADQIADMIADLAVNAVQRTGLRQPAGADPADFLQLVYEDLAHLELALKKDKRSGPASPRAVST